jgi:cell division protein ZapA (FtsZ GTPase activity inhibitor)
MTSESGYLQRPIRIRILDQEYSIITDAQEEDVQKIVEVVNEKLRSIIEPRGGMLEKKTALLAAFHIAGDFYQLRKEAESLRKERDDLKRIVQQRAQRLNDQIKSALNI